MKPETLTYDYLFNELALYHAIDGDLDFLDKLSDKLDTYCVSCGQKSTFVVYKRGYIGVINEKPSFLSYRYKAVFLECSRENTHTYIMTFEISEEQFWKIGQSPSIRDILGDEIKKYRKVLKDDYKNFNQAIGLYSHGVGAGSFVYLRRIFENLIHEKFELAKSDGSVQVDTFVKAKMDEKIKMLANYLPDVLVEHRKIYSIMSLGIHELEDEKCQEYFPPLRLAIELILDEKLAEIEKANKLSSLGKFVSATVAELKR